MLDGAQVKAALLVVTEDVQGQATNTRCGRSGWLVYEPAKSSALEDDLIQRGIFWREEDARLFAIAPRLQEFVARAAEGICHKSGFKGCQNPYCEACEARAILSGGECPCAVGKRERGVSWISCLCQKSAYGSRWINS